MTGEPLKKKLLDVVTDSSALHSLHYQYSTGMSFRALTTIVYLGVTLNTDSSVSMSGQNSFSCSNRDISDWVRKAWVHQTRKHRTRLHQLRCNSIQSMVLPPIYVPAVWTFGCDLFSHYPLVFEQIEPKRKSQLTSRPRQPPQWCQCFTYCNSLSLFLFCFPYNSTRFSMCRGSYIATTTLAWSWCFRFVSLVQVTKVWS